MTKRDVEYLQSVLYKNQFNDLSSYLIEEIVAEMKARVKDERVGDTGQAT